MVKYFLSLIAIASSVWSEIFPYVFYRNKSAHRHREVQLQRGTNFIVIVISLQISDFSIAAKQPSADKGSVLPSISADCIFAP